ncbi:MAG: DUF2147 domain-containing protein [Hyphomicrobiaceae bacterium]|nr:DUF2147 domain-containing protein [Hyphomicrobiaceae bacterium]MCC0024708.1 DUF2147 domain-containing protein [Hyphomicrobiaceae bacterium]
MKAGAIASVLLLASACATLPGAAAAQDMLTPILVGTWITQNQSEVTIEPCEEGFCGYVSKVELPQEVIDKYGPERIAELQGDFRDVNNQDPALRDRPIMGMPMLVLTKEVNPTHLEGKIYNPQDGKTYDGFADIVDGNRIMVGGCVAWRTICDGQIWVRAPVIVADQTELDG